MEDYLRLDEIKDVIEWQLDDVLDINGWDLKKALIQFRKGNATLFEWSNSPVVYKKLAEWDNIYETAKSYFSAKAALYHYYGTAKNTFTSYLQGDQVKYKKYLYALRPLLACKYIEEYNCPPPVLFDDLLSSFPLFSSIFTFSSAYEFPSNPRLPLPEPLYETSSNSSSSSLPVLAYK